MTVRLTDLVRSVAWSEVAFALRRLHPADARDLAPYRVVFDALRVTPPEPTTQRIRIEEGRFREPELGLEFRPWGECLGMAVVTEQPASLSQADILALCLFALTWRGLEPESVRRLFTELAKRISVSDEP